MKYWKTKSHFLVIIGILAISLMSLSGCAKPTYFIPEFVYPGPPPIEVTIDQIYADYMVDEAAAYAKYKGERLLFTEVEVEELGGYYVYIGMGMEVFVKTFFTAGHVKFELRGEDLGIMQNIEQGYVLNIVGECQGLVSKVWNIIGGEPLLFVNDCWVGSVVGDIGTSVYVNVY